LKYRQSYNPISESKSLPALPKKQSIPTSNAIIATVASKPMVILKVKNLKTETNT
jgi:hypothetical protein